MHLQNYTYSQLGTQHFRTEKRDAFPKKPKTKTQTNKIKQITYKRHWQGAEADPGIKKTSQVVRIICFSLDGIWRGV